MNSSDHPRLRSLLDHLLPLRDRLVAHPVYGALRHVDDLRVFLQHHVFAVWDFMSLLKALQRRLTCVDEVWVPRGDAAARRLVNEIVLGEESDSVGGGYTSHFEMYLRAMREAGASTRGIEDVLGAFGRGEAVAQALQHAPPAARDFSAATFAVVRHGSLPAVVGAFTLGREDVIPVMFTALVRDLQRAGHGGLSVLLDYLDRHIELDGGEHGPAAARLLATVCGDDEAAWADAERAAAAALEARIALWDGVCAALPAAIGA